MKVFNRSGSRCAEPPNS